MAEKSKSMPEILKMAEICVARAKVTLGEGATDQEIEDLALEYLDEMDPPEKYHTAP